MAGPSLGEITGIRGDAAIAAGTAGTAANLAELPPDQAGLSFLSQAAGMQAQANRYALDQYYQNMRDYFKNFNDLDVSGIMENDYPAITGEWARLAKDVANNYDVIMNPMKNLERYSELKTREAQLRGKISQSKQDVALRQIYGNFMSTHADFRNPQNEARLSRFTEGDLGTRNREDMMNMMPRFDLMQNDFAKAANMAAQAKTKEQDTASPFQTTTEVNQFYEGAYNDAIKGMLKSNDAYNRSMVNAVKDSFDAADPGVRAQYTNPDGTFRLEDYAVEQLYGPLRQQTDIAVTRDPNAFAKIKAEGDQNLRAIAARGAQERANMKYGKDLGDEDATLLATEIPVRQLAVFGAPDQAGSKREVVQTISQKGTGDKQADEAINKFSSLFGVAGTGERDQVVEGVPLTLDSWLTNAYSIPTGKRTTLDEATGKPIEQDSYLRPSAAWVTTEKDPNARKVVVRYPTGAEGQYKDLVLPYTENFQVLNSAMGANNAVKVGAAKAKLLKQRTGKVLPNYQELDSVEEFKSANTGGTGLTVTSQLTQGAGGPVIPGVPPATGVGAPAGTTPGRTLKYSDFKKQNR